MAASNTVSSLLPNIGKVIFHSTIEGKNAYNKYIKELLENSKELPLEECRKALETTVPPALGAALDTTFQLWAPR
ncbi:MAG: hypothetical protein MRQ09_02105 [Candidatus Midichloria sp.]|nr:hypothetical protein [Candidatus Midichloria sp.]